MNAQASGTPSIPPSLQEELDREAPRERAELERVWALLEAARPDDAAAPGEAEGVWNSLHQVFADGPAPAPRYRDRRPASRRAGRVRGSARWMIPAALVAVILAGALYWTSPVTRSAPPGARLTVVLPDGSTADLHGGTALTYRRGFSILPFVPAASRTVRLDGEAYFDVVHAEKTFVVETFNARVEVLGTTFDVAGWADARSETAVTLASGRVRVLALGAPDAPVELTEPGQITRVTPASTAPSAPRASRLDHALAWRTGGFAVTAQPLSAIFARLERHYGVAITVQDGLPLTDSLTLFYTNDTDVASIVSDICTHKQLTFQATSRGFNIARGEGAVR